MVDFEPTPEERAFAERARAFARECVEGRDDLDRHGHFPLDLYQEAFDRGLLTAVVPEALGGGGVSPLAIALGAEEVAYADVGVATSIFVATLATAPLLLFGTPEQQERWLRPFTAEMSFAAYGFSEPEGSSNLFGRPSSVVARRVDGGFSLTGVKSTITNATVARFCTVFARIEDGPGGLSAFVVAGDAAGLKRHNPYRKLGQRASDTGVLELSKVFVPDADLIGRPEQGMQIATRALTRSRYGIGAMGVGVARRARDEALLYAHGRTTGDGRPLVQAQDFRFRIAEMEAQIQSARMLTWRACWKVATGRGANPIEWSSMAKLVGGNVAVQVANDAIEMLGAQGYMEGGVVEKLFRDAKALQIYEGPQAVQKLLIADSATRKGRVGRR